MYPSLPAAFARFRLQRGLLFGVLIIGALLAFEVFNFSTTEFALSDLLGELNFAGIRWATILAVAFCGIDFAGIARLFTPEQGADEPMEVWYLFGAWLLAAAMNAMLTWWGVSIAILNHDTLGNAVVARETLLKVVPVFVALMVWLIRVLIIGTFSVAGDRLFSQADAHEVKTRRAQPAAQPARSLNQGYQPQPVAARQQSQRSRPQPAPSAVPAAVTSFRPAPKAQPAAYAPAEPEYAPSGYTRPEPTYHPLSMSSQNSRSGGNRSLRS
ncbi:MAG: hypothetical protein OHK0052_22120 [Anaerolineales bacterium]